MPSWEVWAAKTAASPLKWRGKCGTRAEAEVLYDQVDKQEDPEAIALKARSDDGRFYFARFARSDRWMNLHEPRRY